MVTKRQLKLCQKYCTMSRTCHPCKVTNRLKPHADGFVAKEQAGFRRGRRTTGHIFNVRVICEKHLQHKKHMYHVFKKTSSRIDLKRSFVGEHDEIQHQSQPCKDHRSITPKQRTGTLVAFDSTSESSAQESDSDKAIYSHSLCSVSSPERY